MQQVSFLELVRLCPPEVKNFRSKALPGHFHVLVVEIGDPSTLELSHSLSGAVLSEVSERVQGVQRPRNVYYYVIGSNSMNPSMTFHDVQEKVRYNGHPGLPSNPEKTYAVILLFFPNLKEAREVRPHFQLFPSRENMFKPIEIGDQQRFYIKKYMQDIVIYGSPCSSLLCSEFTSLLPRAQRVSNINYVPIPSPLNDDPAKPYVCISRCAENILPMQLESFDLVKATPRAKNDCDFNIKPFSLQGLMLQSTAQKIILNVYNYFETYGQEVR